MDPFRGIRMRALLQHPRLVNRIIIYDDISEGSSILDRIQAAIDSDTRIYHIHGDHLCVWMHDVLRCHACCTGPCPDYTFVIFTTETYPSLKRLVSRNLFCGVVTDCDCDDAALQYYDEHEPKLIGSCNCGFYYDGTTDGDAGGAGAGRF